MKSVFCRVRDYEEGDFLPSSAGYIEVRPNLTLRCQQPDSLDNEEFNLLVFLGRKRLRMRSIDFEFFNTRKESEAAYRGEAL